jgi:peptidoglycan L-alanyl-D-glutamate endopeptidase CwlK
VINSRSLSDLTPETQEKAKALVAGCLLEGITLLIYCTYRDNEYQDTLYAQGRSTKGSVVTNVKGGMSFHNYRLAFDAVPTVDGVAQWNDNALWKRVGAVAERAGLNWGGSWQGFVDKPHFQNSKFNSVQEYLKSLKKP